jgi:diguanylate cyclase (GGDEF)-like protein
VNELTVAVVVALLAVCCWLGWQLRRTQARLRELHGAADARTNELESARIQLQRLSTQDDLTALANHEQFSEFLEREWRRARRDALPLSLVFLDVDHFHSYNSQYGRTAGDECLRQIGRALAGSARRAGDLVARYHRDEFAVVLSSTDDDGAMRVAERVRQAIEALQIPAAKDAGAPVVTASVAVVSALPKSQSAWEELDLIKVARQAMRDARTDGGNRVHRTQLAQPLQPTS